MMMKVVHLKQNIIGGMCTCGRGMEAAAGAREGAKGRCGQVNRTWCATYGHDVAWSERTKEGQAD